MTQYSTPTCVDEGHNEDSNMSSSPSALGVAPKSPEANSKAMQSTSSPAEASATASSTDLPTTKRSWPHGVLPCHLLPALKFLTVTRDDHKEVTISVGLQVSMAAADWEQHRQQMLADWEHKHRSAMQAVSGRTGTKEDRAALLAAAADKIREITDLNDRDLDISREVITRNVHVLKSLMADVTRQVGSQFLIQGTALSDSQLAQCAGKLKHLLSQVSGVTPGQYTVHETRESFSAATRGGRTVPPWYGFADNECVVKVHDLGEPRSAGSGRPIDPFSTQSAQLIVTKSIDGTASSQQYAACRKESEYLHQCFLSSLSKLHPAPKMAPLEAESSPADYLLAYQQLESAMSPGQLSQLEAARQAGVRPADAVRAEIIEDELKRLSRVIPPEHRTMRFTVRPHGWEADEDEAASRLIVPPTQP